MELPLAAAPVIPAHQRAVDRQPGRVERLERVAPRSGLSAPRGAASLGGEAKGTVSKLERHQSAGKKTSTLLQASRDRWFVLFTLQIRNPILKDQFMSCLDFENTIDPVSLMNKVCCFELDHGTIVWCDMNTILCPALGSESS